MQERPSRRSVLASGALALAGLAGCTSGDSQSTTAPTTDRASSTTDATTTSSTTGNVAPSVEWEAVAEFRTWLTDYSTLPESNHRFDYQQVGLDDVVGVGRTAALDVSVDAVEASDDHEVTGEYEGYTNAEATETGSELAVGDEAVLAGSDLSVWIDTHRGERERLEEADPVFTRLFERLPDRGLVSGQYGTPMGGEIDAECIEAWGTSMPSLDAETGTWVYALDPGTSESEIDELEAELGESAFTEEITARATDGRFVTFTATIALPE